MTPNWGLGIQSIRQAKSFLLEVSVWVNREPAVGQVLGTAASGLFGPLRAVVVHLWLRSGGRGRPSHPHNYHAEPSLVTRASVG